MINIDSHVPLPGYLPVLEKINDIHWNNNHTHHCSHFAIVFGHIILSKLHCHEHVFLPIFFVIRSSLHLAINIMKQILDDCDTTLHTNWICDLQPQVPVLEKVLNFHNQLNNGPIILCWQKSLVITLFFNLVLLSGDFLWSVGLLTQLDCLNPTSLQIHMR